MPIDRLKFLSPSYNKNFKKIQYEYYRDQIYAYGIDVIYFRKHNGFYDNSTNPNFVYGEDTTAEYTLSSKIITFMEMNGYSFLMNKFGLENSSEANIYFTTEDFFLQFHDTLGTSTTKNLSGIVNGTCIELSSGGFSGFVSGNIYNNELTGIVSSNISGNSLSELSSNIYSFNFIPTPVPVNPEIASPNYFDFIPHAIGTITGNFSYINNISGFVTVSGKFDGDVTYFENIPANSNPKWKIAPQVGDFIRFVDFEEDNPLEFEITQVIDQDLNNDGLNFLLGKYIWKCSVVRRTPSHEIVNSDSQKEPKIDDKLKHNDDIEEYVDNNIFDYDIEDVDKTDKANSDDIYGGY